jgi:hypothetical protein
VPQILLQQTVATASSSGKSSGGASGDRDGKRGSKGGTGSSSRSLTGAGSKASAGGAGGMNPDAEPEAADSTHANDGAVTRLPHDFIKCTVTALSLTGWRASPSGSSMYVCQCLAGSCTGIASSFLPSHFSQ